MSTKNRPPAGESGPFGARLARLSAPLLIRLHAQPRWVVPVVMLGLCLGGLFTRGVVAFLCLGLLAVFLAWLLLLSWPLITPASRLLRVVAVGVVAAAAAAKLLQ
jgi:hypothetical protein